MAFFRSPPRRALTGLALGLILLAAGALRLAGHDWDQDQHLNVDEYFVTKTAITRVHWPTRGDLGAGLDPQRSPLNPRAGGAPYPYGTLPLYLDKAATALAARLTGNPYFRSLDGALQTGRVLAGLFDTLTALLVFAVGARLWGAGAGLAAAALYALAILPIQTGHFFITDPFMAAFLTATLLGSLLFYQTGRRRFLLLAGLGLGLAMACKLTAASLLVLPLAALIGWRPAAPGPEAGGAAGQGRSRQLLAGVVGLLLAVGVGVSLGDPFAVLDAPAYLVQVSGQAAIQSGADDQWFTRKYVGTWPLVYPWAQLMLLGVGPLVGVAGTAGVAVVAARVWRARRLADGLLLGGAAVYFASVGFLEAKWLRYFLPMVPYLCLFAVAAGSALAGRLTSPGPARVGRGVILGGLIGSALLGALAVSAIYQADHTQVQASRWIDDHIPPGRRIGLETTTVALPLPLPGRPAPGQAYTLVHLDVLADAPGPAVSAMLRGALAHCDYLVVDTTQAARTVPRLPWRYPVQIRYYDLLASGQLGFTPVYTATSYPTLFGWAIPDDNGWVDPSFMDSSHPPIRLFQKTRAVSAAEWTALFADAVRQPSVASRHAP
ncbi:MAG TPA: glycosyltransferase family 39 protein [Chloroflexia bacterium]|nr:glycosyltransferase family 39 protein [Chloroflexia bacterium]